MDKDFISRAHRCLSNITVTRFLMEISSSLCFKGIQTLIMDECEDVSVYGKYRGL